MKKRFVLFDFDGVIADSFALAYNVARIIHPEANLNPDTYREWFEGNVYESIRDTVPGGLRNEQYEAEFGPRMEKEVALVVGMDDVVKTLASGYTLIIVSSTTTPEIRNFLSKHGLSSCFVDVMGSDVHTSKVEKIRIIFERYRINSSESVFITDTLGDMREAKKHEVDTIGVSWGWHTHKTLSQGIPFRIVDKPSELPDAVTDYFARDSV